MRALLNALVCGAWAIACPFLAIAQDKKPAAKPSDSLIIGMAQHLVLEHFQRDPEHHFDVSFDIANLHRQPEEDYFAVVGGFMANHGGNIYRPHAYGIAIRLICADQDNTECWRAEKLVIDQKIILNK